MALDIFKSKLDQILATNVKRSGELDSKFEEYEAQLQLFNDISTPNKRQKTEKANKIIKEEIKGNFQVFEDYNPTPVTRFKSTRSILKDTVNIQSKIQVKTLKRNLMDIDVPKDSFTKLHLLIPSLPTQFDQIHTDTEEEVKPLSCRHNKRIKVQIHVDENLVETLFSHPKIEPECIFPSAGQHLMRKASSMWDDCFN